jgi:hypothetical protein
MATPPYPLFPKCAVGQIVEVRVWRNSAGRKAKSPIWERWWPTYQWDPSMSELQFAKLVAGGQYEVRAFGAPDEGEPMGAYRFSCGGTPRENPPDVEAQTAMQAPTAHETPQRGLITLPGIDPVLNAVLVSWQMMATNYREDSLKYAEANLRLLEVFMTREKTTTAEQQMMADLRMANEKLSKDHERAVKELQKAEIETLELAHKGKSKNGLAEMAIEAVAERLPDMLKPLLESGLEKLLAKPEYVQQVAQAHGLMNAQAAADAAAE